jgi:ATP adenylyltransferase
LSDGDGRVLWSPWRMDWILADKSDGCALCGDEPDPAAPDGLTVHAGEHAIVRMNKYPYCSGHLLVFPRRHVSDLNELEAVERAALDAALGQALGAARAALKPEGVNLGMNLGAAAGAGIPGHLHWHVVPRWAGDTNFLCVTADVRTVPEHIRATRDRIRASWPLTETAR